ncbi:hypothetical protein E3J74_06030 [Candidatus Bathyarchaeota archaeon]|nr:MAG: hypothetical protein E3J74_06030 [Candidatus Bathyarchaeota archaeon]
MVSKTLRLDDVLQVTSSLNFGDLIEIHWLDASEATGQLEHDRFDTPVQSVGYFLAVKGRKTKHIVIAKEIVDNRSYHYNVIPVGMIQNLRIVQRNGLKPYVKRVLKKFAAATVPRLRKKDGWVYATKKHNS